MFLQTRIILNGGPSRSKTDGRLSNPVCKLSCTSTSVSASRPLPGGGLGRAVPPEAVQPDLIFSFVRRRRARAEHSSLRDWYSCVAMTKLALGFSHRRSNLPIRSDYLLLGAVGPSRERRHHLFREHGQLVVEYFERHPHHRT